MQYILSKTLAKGWCLKLAKKKNIKKFKVKIKDKKKTKMMNEKKENNCNNNKINQKKCIFNIDSYCCLSRSKRKCDMIGNETLCEIKKEYDNKKDYPGEEIYIYRRDYKCKNCGNLGAVKYNGKLYSNGLSKETIERYPDIYGKKWKGVVHMAPVGFGGIIPYECCHCHKVGLQGNYMEGYEDLFEKIEINED